MDSMTAEAAGDASPAKALEQAAPPTPGEDVSPASNESQAAPTALHGRRIITAALLLVMVLVSMEMTITSTAMPTIIGDLHGLEHYAWVASIYLLACTVTMPLYGRLADAFGRKRVVIVAIVLFCIGSLLASTSQTMTQLIVYRGLQGLGAGGVMPVVLTILGDIFSLEERARIQGLFSGVWGTSALAGPALGALLVQTLGWRSVFWVNLPFALIALAVLMWKYHERREEHEMDLDLPGVTSLAIASAALLFLVSSLGPGGWGWPAIVALCAVTVIAIVYFAWNERRAKHPILDTEIVTRREIGPAILGSALFGAAFLSLDTYVPLYVQGGRGGDATAAASVVTPVMLTWALSGMVGAPMIVRFGYRKTATLGAYFIIAGFTGLVICTYTDAPQWMLTVILALTGFGFGPTSMSFLISAQEAVTYLQRGGVTSAISFFRTMGGAIGIGVFGAIFNILIAGDMRALRAGGLKPAELLNADSRAHVPAEVLVSAQHAIAGALLWVFVIMLGVAVALWILTRFMHPGEATPRASSQDALEAL